MNFIKASTLKTDMLTRQPNGIPIIFCDFSNRVRRKLSEAGYQEVLLNRELSEMLLKYPKDQRTTIISESVQTIIQNKGKSVLIKDFEMLFDPAYKLDVLKLFCELSRQFQIAIVWCGSVTENHLEYSEPEYPDYNKFIFDHYTVYCVK